ncbi:MAG: sel1 repeat family protein, partial [Planctomycetes bacterium]|nr:sel1 repeat family protein [Planctomycetota bacterium]
QLKVKPDSIAILNDLAWIQATCDNEKIRNPKEAVALAEKACLLTNYKSAQTLDTLATAYAAKGDFAAAVRTTEKAIKLAIAKGDNALVKELKGRLELYKNDKAYLDPFLSD